MLTTLIRAHVLAGWTAMLGGVLSGAVIGLFFHRDDWLGGYASLRRRMLRLAHIAFFGLGLINVVYGLGAAVLPLDQRAARWGSPALLFALVAMPTLCLLTAWRKGFRHLFFLPVTAVAVGVVSAVAGWS